jgi:hypothetical protein
MKVKFSKLAALLLAGVALLAAGCTDYEVDIQKVDKKVDELAVKTAADLKAQVDALTAMISAVEQNYKDADAALKKQLEDQIADLNNLKLDKSTFEEYKAETAQTLKLLSDALKEIQDNYATKKELEDAMAEISAKFDDYVLKSTFDEFVKLAATKAELEEVKAKLEKEIENAKEEMVEKLNAAIDEVNGKIEALDERVTILENAVADIIDELAFAEGDLQGYIDDADAATLEAAMDYTDEYIEALVDYLDELMMDVWGAITILQQRMQSIVFVPDYDDLKITVNMAYVTQEVAPTEQLARAEGAETEKDAAVIDQPFKVQYKFLPAQYAAWVAASYEDLLEFDVKPVNTRAEEVEEENAPALQILAADYDDDVDETGIITFTVLPVNIASAQFAANGLQPVRPLYAADSVYDDYYGCLYWPIFYNDEEGGFLWDDSERAALELVHYVYNLDDLLAYENRTAFAASMRMKYQESVGTGVYHYYYGDIADDFFPEYNEIASTYNVLYPDATEIEILPDPYKPELDEDGNVVTDDEGNTVLVKAVPEYQYLPYSALRENPVGEKEDQNPQGYRIILDQAVPGIEIDGTVYTAEDAAKKGYILPAIKTVFDEFTYDAGTAAEVDEENFKETAQVYAEIEMNPEKSAALRKLAVGNVITGWYHFETAIGETPFYGQVEITKPQGEVKVDAEIVWTYSLDADMDHEIFYNDADPAYARVELPVNVDEESAATLEKNLGVTIEDFRQAEASNVKIVYTDEEGNEVDVTEDITIENVAIDEDGNLTMDIAGFEWDKVYTITADYELDAALVNVIGTLTTVDRNRELMVINMPEYAVVLNGENYDAETDTYTTTPEEGDFLADLFKLFVDRKIINQNDPKDFDDEEAFLGEQTGKEGHLEAYEPEEGENSEYVTIGDDYAVLSLTSPQLYEVWKAGEALTSFVTSYIGQEIEVIWPVTVDLPGYNFLHLANYTFNSQKANGTFITKLDFDDNDGSVIWWSQVYPSYFTTPKSENETEGESQKSRISNRYALADYDVAYINLAELAFNVVDEDDNILEEADIEEANLIVKFVYTDETQGEKELPEVDQLEDFLLYESLWVDNTVFYYRTNEKKFIPARGTLGILSGETVFEIPTRFDEPKASVEYPSENLDYSTYAIVRWTPFQAPKAEGYTIVLDENLVYQVPLFKGMELKDNRPNGVSFYVIKDGEWVIGDAAENATASSKSNGYIEGIASNEAYHITTDFVYDTASVPAQLKKLLSVEEIEGVPYVIYDYTSEVQFHGVITIPVVVALENPWQETIKFVYDITIKGIGD